MPLSAPRGPLFVVANFDEKGGLQRQMSRQAELLAERGLVTVITWHRSRHISVENRSERLAIVRVPAVAAWNREHRSSLARANTAVSVASALTAALALRRRWSAVYAAGLNPEGVVAALAGRALRRPYVIGTWLPGRLGNVARLQRSPAAPLVRRLLGSARAYVAENRTVAHELASAGFDEERVVLVLHPPDLQEFAPVEADARQAARRRLGLDGEGVVVYCGRFDLRHKRLDLLLDGWRRAGLDGWRLVLVGDGPDRARVAEYARAIAPAPILTGWQQDVRPFLAAADAFALPTNFEGSGGCALEAMACGLPGVISERPPYDRLRPDGVVLVRNDVASWGAGLARIATDRRERAELGRRARAWVERHADGRRVEAAFAALLEA